MTETEPKEAGENGGLPDAPIGELRGVGWGQLDPRAIPAFAQVALISQLSFSLRLRPGLPEAPRFISPHFTTRKKRFPLTLSALIRLRFDFPT